MAFYSNYTKIDSIKFLGHTIKVGDHLLITKDLEDAEPYSWYFKIPKGQELIVDGIYKAPRGEGIETIIVFDLNLLDKDVLKILKDDLEEFDEINNNKLEMIKFIGNTQEFLKGDFEIISKTRYVMDFTISLESYKKLTSKERIEISKYIAHVVMPNIVDNISENVENAELTIKDKGEQ